MLPIEHTVRLADGPIAKSFGPQTPNFIVSVEAALGELITATLWDNRHHYLYSNYDTLNYILECET